MIIKSITIENFQSYYSAQTLEFSEGLNLVVGHGGKGKSKLFNAFYWVLFGKIYITGTGWCSTDGLPQSAKFTMQDYEFINAKSLSEASVGSKVVSKVYIEIEDDKGIEYRIERSVIAERLDNEDWNDTHAWQVHKSELSVSYENRMGTQIEQGIIAEQTISDIFPEGIRNYIWFQGESLDNLINFRNKDTLKSAVKHISYYPFYEKLSAIITQSKGIIEKDEAKKLREYNKGNASLDKALKERDYYNNLILKEEENKKAIQENINIINIKLVDYEGKLKGVVDYTKLNQEYNRYNLDFQKVQNELSRLDEEQRKLVPNFWVLRGIEPMIKQSKQIIKEYTAFQDTVPEKKYLDNPGRAKLEEILEQGQCFVCGSDATEGTKASDWIKRRLREQEQYLKELEEYNINLEFSKQFERFVGKIQDYPDVLLTSLEQIDKQYEVSENEIDRLLRQRKIIQEKKETLDKEIEEIKRKNGIDPIKEAGQGTIISDGIKASRTNLEKEQRKLQALQETINEYKNKLKDAEREIEKLISKKGDITSVPETEWKNISEFLEKICKKVQENARKELLYKIETRANEYYQKFTEHDKGYKGEVKINEDYSIEYDAGLNTSHEDRKKMSIINAMLSLNQEALGIFYPFISDAPTSSFDIPTTHKYLLGIKDIFGQSIIMTKDVELEGEAYQQLLRESKVSRIYALESKVSGNDMQNPKLNEVSTIINRLK